MSIYEDLILKKYQPQTDTWNKILDYVTAKYGGGHGHRLTNNETSKILIMLKELERLKKIGMSTGSHISTQLIIKLDAYLDSISLSSTQITHLLREIVEDKKIKRPTLAKKRREYKKEEISANRLSNVQTMENNSTGTCIVDFSEEEYLKLKNYADSHYGGSISRVLKIVLDEKGII